METAISDLISEKIFYQCLNKITDGFGEKFGDREKKAFEKCCEMYLVAYKISSDEYLNYINNVQKMNLN